MNSSSEIASRLRIAVDAAQEAGRLTREFFQRTDLQVDYKEDQSPVTPADRGAEKLLRQRIVAAFPHDAILGEEFGEQPGSSGYRWILDPIDGTRSFVCGVPLYGTLVGVERDGRSLVGVICIPALEECVYAGIGQGAWYCLGSNPPCPARVRRPGKLEDAVFLTSQIDLFTARGALHVFQTFEQRAAVTRTWGDCYGYLLVATGRADLMIDPEVKAWDAAALPPILEEAGGVLTDWQGQPGFLGGDAIGCHPDLLDQVLKVTRPFTPPPQPLTS